MRNLTELLQEIPLDEMMGGSGVMKKTAENNEINEKTVEQTSAGARIRSKAPAAAAIAACAVIAVAGAVQMSQNNFDVGSADEDTGITTDAEDMTDEDFVEEEPEFDIYEEPVDDTEYNIMMSRLKYEALGEDYELAKDHIRVMDGKVGEIVAGFRHLDMRVADVRVCYPYYAIDIAFQTDDGSVLFDGEEAGAIFADVKFDGEFADHGVCVPNMMGDKAIATLLVDLTRDRLENVTADSDVDIIVYSIDKSGSQPRGTLANGRFEAHFKAGELFDHIPYHPDTVPVPSMESGAVFHWDMLHYSLQRDLEFSVNGMTWSNCGVKMNITVTKGDEAIEGFSPMTDEPQVEGLMEDYELGWDIDAMFRQELRFSSVEEMIGRRGWTITGEVDFDPERDYNFIKLVHKDGTVSNLDYDDLTCVREDDGSYTLYFNKLSNPYDADDVEAFLVGDGRIEAHVGVVDYNN